MHARKTRSEWQQIIRAFKRSGVSHAAFCDSRGLNIKSFRGWLYRLRRASAPEATIELVPVGVATPVIEAPAPLTIGVAGLEVSVAVGTDVAYVAALVGELRRC